MAGRKNGSRPSPFYNMKKNNQKTDFFKNFNQAYYTTDSYDDYLRRYQKEGLCSASNLIKKIKPLRSWHFLDVGCGMGGVVLALRSLNYQAWGTEVSPYCLKFSPAKEWLQFADICNLPFLSNSFEVITCVDVLCYLNRDETKQAVKELTRVAKHYLGVETICRGSPNSDQIKNPDWLRQDRYLLPENDLRRMFLANRTFFREPLYPRQQNTDFNGLFVK